MTVSVTKKALNVREKLAELDKPTGIAGEAMLRAETPQEQFNLIGAGRRNLIINGGFDVWQRGTSFSSPQAAFTADRFYARAGTSGVMTATRREFAIGTELEGNSYYMELDQTTARTGANSMLWQYIEDVRSVPSGKVTASFYASAGAPKTVRLYFYQRFGSGGSSDVAVAYKDFDLTTSWKKYTFTFDNPSMSGKTLGSNSLYIWEFRDETHGTFTFNVTGVQLELGKVATPFEHRSYGEELALCQRYYYRLSTADLNGTMAVGFATSTTGARGVITFPVPMRVAPTGIEHTGSGANYKVAHTFTATTCSAVPSFSNACPASAGIQFTVASGLTAGQGIAIERNSGTAYIGFTGAEL